MIIVPVGKDKESEQDLYLFYILKMYPKTQANEQKLIYSLGSTGLHSPCLFLNKIDGGICYNLQPFARKGTSKMNACLFCWK